MSFIQTISDFFESIFKRSSPEVQKKQLLKKLDSEIREFNPLICKSGMLQPNFGEAIYGLYKNCKIRHYFVLLNKKILQRAYQGFQKTDNHSPHL